MNIFRKIIKNLNKNGLKRFVHFCVRKNFKIFEKYLAIHITPAHFYSPIPQTNELNPDVYKKVYDCIGIDWNLDKQLDNLSRMFPKYYEEYVPASNSGLSLVDAFVLYAMVREKKPNVMIEIGAGETTKITLQALRKNKLEGKPCKFYSIEPYPGDELRKIQDENFELIDRKLQDVQIDLLSTADLLFIDSSHVSKIDSDVNYEILEIIPTLKVGSLIHWHDIVMPTNYWKDWVNNGNMFWNESYMVHAFMLFNTSFKIVWAARYMQLNNFEKMHQLFPYFKQDHRLMSFWIERVG